MINVYIVSGFLGSGKTTFIQKLLKEKKFNKVMLLENEFGEVGVDGAFFDSSLNVKEINNGCICCSLQGDFAEALEEIEEMGVSDLIIEPSGVGKLSEIINVVKEDEDFRIISHICIVDVKTCKKYSLNFKEYFSDQVIAANAIVLSHCDVADEDTINRAIDIVKQLNDHALIISKPIFNMPIDDLLDAIVAGGDILPDFDDDHNHEGEEHHHHHHDHDHEHHHHHHDGDDGGDEDELFKNMILRPKHLFSEDELKNIFSNIPEDIIRIKGYVLSQDNKTLYFNYVLNEYNIFYGTDKNDTLVSIIGTSIDKAYFKGLFNE